VIESSWKACRTFTPFEEKANASAIVADIGWADAFKSGGLARFMDVSNLE
jgi:hypothetical protein